MSDDEVVASYVPPRYLFSLEVVMVFVQFERAGSRMTKTTGNTNAIAIVDVTLHGVPGG